MRLGGIPESTIALAAEDRDPDQHDGAEHRQDIITHRQQAEARNRVDRLIENSERKRDDAGLRKECEDTSGELANKPYFLLVREKEAGRLDPSDLFHGTRPWRCL